MFTLKNGSERMKRPESCCCRWSTFKVSFSTLFRIAIACSLQSEHPLPRYLSCHRRSVQTRYHLWSIIGHCRGYGALIHRGARSRCRSVTVISIGTFREPLAGGVRLSSTFRIPGIAEYAQGVDFPTKIDTCDRDDQEDKRGRESQELHGKQMWMRAPYPLQ